MDTTIVVHKDGWNSPVCHRNTKCTGFSIMYILVLNSEILSEKMRGWGCRTTSRPLTVSQIIYCMHACIKITTNKFQRVSIVTCKILVG